MTISFRTYRWLDDFPANSLLATLAGKIFSLLLLSVSQSKAMITNAFFGAFWGFAKNFPCFSRAAGKFWPRNEKGPAPGMARPLPLTPALSPRRGEREAPAGL